MLGAATICGTAAGAGYAEPAVFRHQPPDHVARPRPVAAVAAQPDDIESRLTVKLELVQRMTLFERRDGL
ncbi:hypothetical protein DPM13_17725 [Paracoccus mutanolyticus]|uniref:Uncharacterized protein n=1 Tax=Paracoccus mutanolyticus TaxID=1499308 RepID=A0ABN5M859_9RHOB|nr:hypothetical protein [Paracoccus mutanolyticus]AWX94139.1 hypothetical protein DPM13_17725 [Paracoccus mutanolyticus]